MRWFWRAVCRVLGHLWLSESIVEHVFSPATMRHEHVELAVMRCERCGTWWDDMNELEDGDDDDVSGVRGEGT